MVVLIVSALIALKLKSIASLIVPLPINSPSYVGVAAFAAGSPRFPCSQYLEINSQFQRPIMPVLVGTFGYSSRCVRRFMRQNSHKPHAVELFLSNGPCQFNARCGRYERSPKYNARWASLRILRRGNYNTLFVISPVLEDRFSTNRFNRVMHKVMGVIRQHVEVPYLTLRNPVYGYSRGNADLLERHSLWVQSPTVDVISNDGTEVELSDLPRYYNRHNDRLALVLWDGELQGIRGSSFIDPRKRAFSVSESLRTKSALLIKRERYGAFR